MNLTRQHVEEQYRMLLKTFTEKSAGVKILTPSEEMIQHCIETNVCPFAEHALTLAQETQTRKLFLYPYTDEKVISSECWINKTFAQNLAEKHFVRTTINEWEIGRMGITFNELLETVVPEMEMIYPFLQIEVDDHTQDLVHYIVLTSCTGAYKA